MFYYEENKNKKYYSKSTGIKNYISVLLYI